MIFILIMVVKKGQLFLGLIRIFLGFIFLWAFFDKTLGLGFATPLDNAWISGGSPTTGFLLNATHGPLSIFYQSLANNLFVDWLFMIGLLGIGLALTLGIGVRIAGYSGALLMVLMYSAAMPPTNNPIIDEHIIYALILLLFANTKMIGHWLGMGAIWHNTSLVKRYQFLE